MMMMILFFVYCLHFAYSANVWWTATVVGRSTVESASVERPPLTAALSSLSFPAVVPSAAEQRRLCGSDQLFVASRALRHRRRVQRRRLLHRKQRRQIRKQHRPEKETPSFHTRDYNYVNLRHFVKSSYRRHVGGIVVAAV